ncbi:Diaminohydroxyphosphoribosylamino-pyrimidine deaminase [Mycena indigotica]|uniref:Diaminohydroxyphosphoribosylamino-pyrimidine deaminase n=1 Tax=Mycena indigotica TaxID=2126181 RepID=A0A8H6VYH1_9AGAR|nr:Diaminohydroxyphosphoribosylamino-pyrimidine deaminase [Mycena indigotica]KAF7294873.1 Diaminohydroxyphosphoribosylamino-pyrimidine deaminase [Mycena indigotica]
MTQPQYHALKMTLMMQAALAEARKCEPVPTAFSVGCVIAVPWPNNDSDPTIISTGYSRELPGNTHAEANALHKYTQLTAAELAALFKGPNPPSVSDIASRLDVYTTMEPCSVRTSGLAPCADALIAAKIRRCFIGTGEPDDFVQCEGAERLKNAGIELVWLDSLQEECLAVARNGHHEV